MISGYIIQLIAFQWDMACIRSSPDSSLLLRKWVRPARLHYITDYKSGVSPIRYLACQQTLFGERVVASFPGLHPYFVLQFVFSITLSLPCIILNATEEQKMGGGLGTRLGLTKECAGTNFKLEFSFKS